MSETKIHQRFEKSFDAFYHGGHSAENVSLRGTANAELLQNDAFGSLKSEAFVNLIKQIVLFFPGTFVLFIVSFASTMIFIDNPFNATLPRGRVIWIALWFLAGIFMTWSGIGDWRNSKHLVIPGSIISTGIVLGFLSGILSLLSERLQHIVWSDAYPLYLLPIALVVPFLAKGLVDRKFD